MLVVDWQSNNAAGSKGITLHAAIVKFELISSTLISRSQQK